MTAFTRATESKNDDAASNDTTSKSDAGFWKGSGDSDYLPDVCEAYKSIDSCYATCRDNKWIKIITMPFTVMKFMCMEKFDGDVLWLSTSRGYFYSSLGQ